MSLPNVSADIVWEIVRPQNSFLVKRKTNGGIQLSRDPMNLKNVHSRKYAGFVNDKAIGVAPNGNRGLKVTSKKSKSGNKPAAATSSTDMGDGKSSRKVYKSVAGMAAKKGYRGDLRSVAVQRASAIRRSQRPVKPDLEKKPRGVKARKAAEEDE